MLACQRATRGFMQEDLSAYIRRIGQIHQELGIPEGYADACGLALQKECTCLVQARPDVFGREVLLEPASLRAWISMQQAAWQAGINLQLISGFRSVDYQAGIFRRKLEIGQDIHRILQVNAAPGFSEHHTGQAIDVGTSGVEPLDESFEDSPAFSWLSQYAADYGFSLSFPRDNPHSILYEPWHWKYTHRD